MKRENEMRTIMSREKKDEKGYEKGFGNILKKYQSSRIYELIERIIYWSFQS